MVPKARLELAWAVARHPLKMVCLPVPPLRHLSFSKYHILFKQTTYFFCAGAAGTAGGAGAGTAESVAPFGGVGAAAGAWTGADFPLPDIIEEDEGCPETYAKVSDVNIKITAALVVNLLKKDVPPPAPKTD